MNFRIYGKNGFLFDTDGEYLWYPVKLWFGLIGKKKYRCKISKPVSSIRVGDIIKVKYLFSFFEEWELRHKGCNRFFSDTIEFEVFDIEEI